MPFKEAFPTKRSFAASIMLGLVIFRQSVDKYMLTLFFRRSCPLFSCPCFPQLFDPRPCLSASCPFNIVTAKSIPFLLFRAFVFLVSDTCLGFSRRPNTLLLYSSYGCLARFKDTTKLCNEIE